MSPTVTTINSNFVSCVWKLLPTLYKRVNTPPKSSPSEIRRRLWTSVRLMLRTIIAEINAIIDTFLIYVS